MKTLPCSSFEDMISSVQEGKADLAMVPVENSSAGRVADIHHLLPDSGLHIIDELFFRVNHMLLGLKNSKISDLLYVKSHAQGLSQCRNKIKKYNLIPCIHPDTAGSAKEISELNDINFGAIASELASEIYDLKILKRNFEDSNHNTTRFLIMSKKPIVPQLNESKFITTLIFSTRSVPAALYKALGGFATNGINLTKLESYMIDGKMTATQFYVDIEGHPETQAMKHALNELQFFCGKDKVKILGTYNASPQRNLS
jgi:prephenate dehydratase